LASETWADDRIKLDLARNLRSRGFLQEGMSNRLGAKASYDEALAIVQSLKPTDGMSEPLYRVEARIVQSIGWLYLAMGKEEDAVTWLRKACTILDDGLAATKSTTGSPPDKESAILLANTLNTLSGPLGAVGRLTESLADQQRALDVVGKLTTADPADPILRQSYSVTYFNIGGLYRSMARPDQAFSAFRKGLEILDKLVEDYPAIIDYRRFQARCLNGCGDSAEAQGRTEEALTYFHAARAAWKKVVDDNPGRYAEPVELGSTHNRIGWLLFSMGKLTEALEQYEAAREVFQQLQDWFPPHLLPRTRSELSNVLINIAEIQRRQGRLTEARTSCDQAIAIREAVIREFPEVTGYGWRMGECLLRSGQVRLAAGDVANAAADWRRALEWYERIPRRGGELAMFEAGCHALLSGVGGKPGSGVTALQGASEAEKAMAILGRIVAEGYHDPLIKNESCLMPLHGREDFKKLFATMTNRLPANPAKKQ
jgi:tetratricopeptide (TPR) repeat protein